MLRGGGSAEKKEEEGKGGGDLTDTQARKTNFGDGLFQFHTERPVVSGEGF